MECPFDVDTEAQCEGQVSGDLAARDPLEINDGVVGDLGFILTMAPGPGPLTRARSEEFTFRVGKQAWKIDFDDVACDVPPAEDIFLEIEASDAGPESGLDDPAFREKWYISTGGGTKTGCLSKVGPGATRTTPNGKFDLTFGYTVCILANPDENDDCFVE